ncbi:MAG: tol-pal system protein YbgF [Candidatus Methylomirabilia bacterium]
MRSIRVPWWAVAGALLFVLAGCASRATIRQASDEVARLRVRLAGVREVNESTTRELARMTLELKDLAEEVARVARAGREVTAQVSRLEAGLAQTERAVLELESSVDGLSREVSRLAATPKPAEPTIEKPPAQAPSPEQLYASALANLRGGEHGQAVLEFLDFIAMYPRHHLAGSAQYWIGEAYYLQKDYRQALAEFRKVVQEYEESEKVADGLLKIGLCYKALHQPQRARAAWKRVIREFSGSEAARRAARLIQARATSSRPAR